MDADQNVEEKSSGESDDIVLLSPPAKKARMPTISWDSEKIVAALERAYVIKDDHQSQSERSNSQFRSYYSTISCLTCKCASADFLNGLIVYPKEHSFKVSQN
jgi:hypothetical protein